MQMKKPTHRRAFLGDVGSRYVLYGLSCLINDVSVSGDDHFADIKMRKESDNTKLIS